jgi:hypothetical protein
MHQYETVTCWNCETIAPGADFPGNRCPFCGARDTPPPALIFATLTLFGAVAGWVGGALFGAICWASGWGLGWAGGAKVGSALGGVVCGIIGVVAAVLTVIESAASRKDPMTLLRGAEIKRRRAEEQAAQAAGEPAEG